MTLVSSRMVRGRCPVCGGEHVTCGPASDSVPVDQRMEVAAVGGPLKKYNVTISGSKTVMKLNEADAERYGGTLVNEGAEPRLPDAGSEAEEKADEGAPNKTRTSANKSRTARGKAAPGGD